jgi:glycerophosphoryl diester phosphodiesterase
VTTRRKLLLGLGAVVLSLSTAILTPVNDTEAKKPTEPLVIGHRGASGYRPEHTLASYQLAIDMGADYVEPDLVSTKDGVLVARHENEIGGTTNVSTKPEFAARKTTKVVDGVSITGWFTEDFTLAELKTLRAKERIPDVRPQNATYDGQFPVPTLQEVIDLVKANEKARGNNGRNNRIGIYPETKHPTYFAGIGLPLEPKLIQLLAANGYKNKNDAAFIQSFEVGNLKRLATMTKLPRVQLIDALGKPYDFVVSGDPRTYADLVKPAGLAEIATYASGVGVNKNLIVPRDAANNLLTPTALIQDAHAKGLIVHGWTFRVENAFLPNQFRRGNPADPAYLRQQGDLAGEIKLFLDLGIDGFFTDNSDIGVAARDAWVEAS